MRVGHLFSLLLYFHSYSSSSSSTPHCTGRPVDREREDIIEKIRQDRYSMLLKPTHEYDTFQELQVM